MEAEVRYSQEPEDFFYTDVNVPCQAACPAATNIPAYIRAVYEGAFDRSYAINRMANILPGVLGRICSRPCEERCRHGESGLGEPVNICHIKRAAADLRAGGRLLQAPLPSPPGPHQVAVIGAGPAGLAAAHDLALMGFSVVLYEAMERPGGMLRYGIPPFRLPREVLEAEIDDILSLGVRLKTGVRVGKDVTLDALKAEADAVLLALGCYRAKRLEIPGEDLPGVYSGLQFMMDVCRGTPPSVGRRVLVIGAGFTAFDCARSALRLGAREVSICLRRTEEDLRVTKDEVHETKTEGIKIRSLMISQAVLGEERALGVRFVRARPGALREDGKREVSPILGSEFDVMADTVIVATGQSPEKMGPFGDWSGRGSAADPDTLRTPVPGLYVAGDFMTGPSTVIASIASGRQAAARIALDLAGALPVEEVVRLEEARITDRERAWDFIPRQEMPTVLPPAARLERADLEVETGLNAELAAEESKRCYLCYLHYEIDISRCIYCRYCIDVAPRDCIKLVKAVKTNDSGAVVGLEEAAAWNEVNAVVIDNARCIRCGACVRVCPMDCISVTRVERIQRMAAPGGSHGP